MGTSQLYVNYKLCANKNRLFRILNFLKSDVIIFFESYRQSGAIILDRSCSSRLIKFYDGGRAFSVLSVF